jgi:hypothetical protein
MIRSYRYVGILLLSAAVSAPLAIAKPAVAIQDHDDHDRDRDNRRVYDPYHKDYHNWDEREDRAYRGWLAERHYEYRDFHSLKHNQQKAYWNWRHEHEEHEHHD